QRGVLSTAFPRARRHAAAHRRLSRRLCRLELRLLAWLVRIGVWYARVLLWGGAGLHAQAAGGRQSLGRGRDHAGMDAAVAAAVPPIQRAAAHQVRSPDVTDISALEHRPQITSFAPVYAVSEASVGDYLALMKPRVMSL